MSRKKRTPKEIADAKLETALAYKQVFNTDPGRLVLEDIAKVAHFDTDGFKADPLEMAHIAGKRSVFLAITTILRMTREDLMALTGVRGRNEDE